MSVMASQITSVPTFCSGVCLGTDQRKHQSSALLAFVRGIHRWPVVSLHKGPVTRRMFPFEDVIMIRTHSRTTHLYSMAFYLYWYGRNVNEMILISIAWNGSGLFNNWMATITITVKPWIRDNSSNSLLLFPTEIHYTRIWTQTQQGHHTNSIQ